MKTILTSIRALIVFTLLTGLLYPLAITAIATGIFPWQAHGSLVKRDGEILGSQWIAQKFSGERYFHSRPSAADFSTVPSGASNQGFTSAKLIATVRDRQASLGQNAPSDLLYASASGIDPHISPEAARFQAARVAASRNIPVDQVIAKIDSTVEGPQWGIFGEPRVNVLKLNLALDAAK